MMPYARYAPLALAAGLCVATSISVAVAEPVRDAGGRNVDVRDASRVISIGSSVTEILYALGQSERVVAVDTTSLFPPEALKSKPNVGYYRQLSPEGVIGLAPSVILAVEGSGPKEAVSVLQAAAIPFVQIPDRFSGDGIIEKIRIVAKAVGAEAAGECLAQRVAGELQTMARLRQAITQPLRTVFILSFMNGRPMVAGRNTAADGVMHMAGAVNVFDSSEGYKLVSDEALVAGAPDAVVAMQRPGLDLDAKSVFTHAAFRPTPAASQNRFLAMDGLYMLGFGPRTAQAARELSLWLYPHLASSAAPSDMPAAGSKPCKS
jgi:iron complex transport system substrate-binding protein